RAAARNTVNGKGRSRPLASAEGRTGAMVPGGGAERPATPPIDPSGQRGLCRHFDSLAAGRALRDDQPAPDVEHGMVRVHRPPTGTFGVELQTPVANEPDGPARVALAHPGRYLFHGLPLRRRV